MNGEEEACALVIEQHSKVKRWVRNLDRTPTSFRLVTSSDAFYPDFAAELTDGRSLVVEYKGAQLADSADAQEKELVGKKWAEASQGKLHLRDGKGAGLWCHHPRSVVKVHAPT